MASIRIDPSLTAGQLRTALDYNPVNGLFTWRNRIDRTNRWNSRYAGRFAGTMASSHGYMQISIDGCLHLAHRLAYLHMTGEWPGNQIDHVDGNRSNNRWLNLRSANQSENNANQTIRSDNSSGYKGVYWHAGGRKWKAQIVSGHKHHHIGYYDTAEEAAEARSKAAEILHGEFARLE